GYAIMPPDSCAFSRSSTSDAATRSSRVVTRSAPAAHSGSASSWRATPMAYMPPALAAAMPAGAASTTKQRPPAVTHRPPAGQRLCGGQEQGGVGLPSGNVASVHIGIEHIEESRGLGDEGEVQSMRGGERTNGDGAQEAIGVL